MHSPLKYDKQFMTYAHNHTILNQQPEMLINSQVGTIQQNIIDTPKLLPQ